MLTKIQIPLHRKLWTQIIKVADTNGVKSWNHEVSVKVAGTKSQKLRTQTISTCRDVCDEVCDKSATNPFVLL